MRARVRSAPAILALALLAGCTLSPGRYASFDEWLVGDPEADYATGRAEYTPAARPVYGIAWALPYGVRDGLRLGVAPVVFVYYAVARGLGAVPQAFFAGPDRPPPLRDLPPDDLPREPDAPRERGR